MSGFSSAVSDLLDPSLLERRSRRLLAAGYLFAAVMLAIPSLTLHAPPRVALAPEKPERIIHADIIELPPRSEAPAPIRKPEFSRRPLHPGSFSRPGPALPGSPGFEGKNLPTLTGDRPYAYTPESIQSPEWRANTDSLYRMPDGIASGGLVERRGPRDIPLREEMLKSEDFIWSKEGQRIGMIEYNPRDKLAIRGIVPIPVLFSDEGVLLSPGMDGLREGILKYTDLTIGRIRRFYLTQNTPLDYPFFYINSDLGADPESDTGEARRLREYLFNGGFVFFECSRDNEFSKHEVSMRNFVQSVFGPRHKLRIIPNDHPIYHCYFDFPDGAPLNPESAEYYGNGRSKGMPWLEGVWIEGRLAAVFSNKGYGWHWDQEDGGGSGLRMGINLFVYALRQEGGNTVKRYDPSLKPGIHALRNIAGRVLIPERNSRPTRLE